MKTRFALACLTLTLFVQFLFTINNASAQVDNTFKGKPMELRSTPKELSEDEVKAMLKTKGFYDRDWNKNGKGIENDYEIKVINGDKVIVDRTTDLMWQKSGSPSYMIYADAERYINELNDNRFAGFNDWRLPTLEEAMSLMEPTQKNKNLYIDPLFNGKQKWIWTADMTSSSVAWVVFFYNGDCGNYHVASLNSVRGVR
ncbi:MAG TPA: DUF1566 domain-containing protein [Thermodesulfovibrionia bacterium]|nr:DUF1566 domain-containing protein [Thermodesulfovibrionia bacterium]